MSDSKIVKANEKIAENVVKGYKAIGGYKKIEDKFVDKFLKKDGETIEEAKARLKADEEKRKEEHEKKMEEIKEKK